MTDSSQDLRRIDAAMQRHVDDHLLAGVVTLVAKEGEIQRLSAVGFRHAEAEAAMQTDTIFRIASMTKPITSAALMMLVDDGLVGLEDPASRYLPEFAELQVATTPEPYRLVPAKRPIEVRHLLAHTAGLANLYRGVTRREYRSIADRQGADETVADFVERMVKVPLNFHPGDAWEYSRATCAVGRIVEVVSGQSLDEFFHARIFGPLGMVDTHFFLPPEKLDRFAAYYAPDMDGGITLEEAPGPESRWLRQPQVYFMGSGGLVSTATDYFRFQQMVLNGGELYGKRLLAPEAVAAMTTNQTGDLPLWLIGPGYGFGLGYSVVTDPGQADQVASRGTYGWGGVYGTYSWVDPVQKIVAVLMTQLRPYDHLKLRQEFASLVYTK